MDMENKINSRDDQFIKVQKKLLRDFMSDSTTKNKKKKNKQQQQQEDGNMRSENNSTSPSGTTTLISNNNSIDRNVSHNSLYSADTTKVINNDADDNKYNNGNVTDMNFSDNPATNQRDISHYESPPTPPPAKEETSIEEVLYNHNHKAFNETQEFYKQIADQHSKNAVVIIFILHVIPKSKYKYQKEKQDQEEGEAIEEEKRDTGNETEEMDEVNEKISKLKLYQQARHAFQVHLFHKNNSKKNKLALVKYGDERIFAKYDISENKSIKSIIHSAFQSMIAAQDIISSIETPYYKLKVNSGMSIGKIFELDNGCDFYGDPVNIASKLAEDVPNRLADTTMFGDIGDVIGGGGGGGNTTSSPPEMLISLNNANTNKEDEMNTISTFKHGLFQSKRISISGVDIEFYKMTKLDKKKQNTNFGFGSCNCLGSKNKKYISSMDVIIETKNDLDWEEAVMLQSDLSGFTKLTKKYGILHFMTLIIHCRKIFGQYISSCNGQGCVMKYEGDNIICKFGNTTTALEFMKQVYQSIQEYNNGKDDDYQIKIKFGLAKGLVLVSNDGDIIGEAWEQCCTLAEERAEVGEVLITEEIANELISLDDESSTNYQFDLRQDDAIGCYYNVNM